MGEAFLDDVRGPFALTLVDPLAGRAIAARDGMGNRSASYVLRDDLFAAAVGIEGGGAPALLAQPGVSSDLDEVRLAEYYGYGESSGPETFFRDVRHLLPGELLVVERSRAHRRWLPRPRLDLRLEPSWDEAVETLAQLLETSVRRSLQGHHRVAVWLSGGLDSTPLAALGARVLPEWQGRPAVEGISWQLTDPEGDERAFIEPFARASNIPISWIPCDDALAFADLARWPLHPASPEQTSYRWFHERSYARARELGADLVMTGFTGDGLYLDARRWLWTLLRAGEPARALHGLRGVAAKTGWWRALRSELVGPLRPKRRRLRRFLPSWLTEQTRVLLEARARWPSDLASARRPAQAERVLALVEANGEHLEAWYAAQHGLRAATPLRDFDLVQFLLAIPDHFFRQGTETRPILRAAIRGLVPEVVRRRSGKAAFSDVFYRSFAKGRLAWASPLLRSSDALWRPHVRAAEVERWLAGDLRDDWDHTGLMHCIHAELWRFWRGGGELAALAAHR